MDEGENTFPMDVDRDPSSRPWKFRPEGYLVVILADEDEGKQAEAALVAAGLVAQDVKLYAGKQILENYEAYTEQRTITAKVVGAVVDDTESRDLYHRYAREDRSALWLRLPDEADAPKAFGVLADHDYLHTRHHGSGRQADFEVS